MEIEIINKIVNDIQKEINTSVKKVIDYVDMEIKTAQCMIDDLKIDPLYISAINERLEELNKKIKAYENYRDELDYWGVVVKDRRTDIQRSLDKSREQML